MADDATNAPEGGEKAHAADTTLSAGDTKDEGFKPRTFETQEDLDRFMHYRLAREREKYVGFDEFKDKAAKFDELQEQTSTTLEKAVKAARKEERTLFDKERRSNRLQVAVSNHARELADVDDVVSNLTRGDTTAIFTDEGQINDEALGTALTDLLERKPHLRAGGQVPTGDADAGRGASSATLPPEQQHNQDLLGALGLKRT